MSPVGEPPKGTTSATEYLQVIQEFHELGWVHLDPRLPNFTSICCNGSDELKLLDLATCQKTTEGNSLRLRTRDFGLFACSWFGEVVQSDQDWESSLARPDLVEAVKNVAANPAAIPTLGELLDKSRQD